MATNFTKQASSQLSPAFTGQIDALKSQMPAINTLYDALNTRLDQSRAPGYLSINEDASARGLLRSTIPVNNIANFEQNLLNQRADYASQRAEKLGDLNSQIAGIGVNRANAIAQLAQLLRQQDLASKQFAFNKAAANRQFRFQKATSNRDYRLRRSLADREYQLQKELAALGIG